MSKIRIYQSALILENVTYLILIELADNQPREGYIYTVPRSISHKQICDFEERYFVLCDN